MVRGRRQHIPCLPDECRRIEECLKRVSSRQGTSESVQVYNKQNTPRDLRRLPTRPLFLNSTLNSPPSQHSLSATISMNQAVATSLKFNLLLLALPRCFGGEIQSFLDLGELSWMKKLQRSN